MKSLRVSESQSSILRMPPFSQLQQHEQDELTRASASATPDKISIALKHHNSGSDCTEAPQTISDCVRVAGIHPSDSDLSGEDIASDVSEFTRGFMTVAADNHLAPKQLFPPAEDIEEFTQDACKSLTQATKELVDCLEQGVCRQLQSNQRPSPTNDGRLGNFTPRVQGTVVGYQVLPTGGKGFYTPSPTNDGR
jgi:hypothetical protein